MRLPELDAGEDGEIGELMPAASDVLQESGDVEPLRVDQAILVKRSCWCDMRSFDSDRQERGASRCSVKASAGNPMRMARAQVARMRPLATDDGPPVSQDHSLCTCESAGSTISVMFQDGDVPRTGTEEVVTHP